MTMISLNKSLITSFLQRMVYKMNISREDLPTKTAEKWILFEDKLHHMGLKCYNSENQLTKQNGQSNDISCQYPLGRIEQNLKYYQIKLNFHKRHTTARRETATNWRQTVKKCWKWYRQKFSMLLLQLIIWICKWSIVRFVDISIYFRFVPHF